MIVYECNQGEREWYDLRAGVVTASMFAEVRKVVDGLDERQSRYVDEMLDHGDEKLAREAAGYKAAPTSTRIQRAIRGEPVGDWTEAAKNYAFRLAVERICGYALDEGGFETYAMRRGKEMEPAARARHEREIDHAVVETGFVTTDCGRFGASADGLVGLDGGAEYKCLISPEPIRDIVLNRDISGFTDQVQGGLWITGRQWWDFALYCPALAGVGRDFERFRVHRDEDYIQSMAADLERFDALVEQYRSQLEAKAAEKHTHTEAETADLF